MRLFAIYHRKIGNSKIYGILDLDTLNWATREEIMITKNQVKEVTAEQLKSGLYKQVMNVIYKKNQWSICSKYKAIPDLDKIRDGEKFPLAVIVKDSANQAEETKNSIFIILQFTYDNLFGGFISKEKSTAIYLHQIHQSQLPSSVNRPALRSQVCTIRVKSRTQRLQQKAANQLEYLKSTVANKKVVWTIEQFKLYMESEGYTYKIESSALYPNGGILYSVDTRCKILHIPYGIKKLDCLFNGVPDTDTTIIVSPTVTSIVDISILNMEGFTRPKIKNIYFQEYEQEGEYNDFVDGTGLMNIEVTGTAEIPDCNRLLNMYIGSSINVHIDKELRYMKSMKDCFNGASDSQIELRFGGLESIETSFENVRMSHIKIKNNQRLKEVYITGSFNHMDCTEVDLDQTASGYIEGSFRSCTNMERLVIPHNTHSLRNSLSNSSIKHITLPSTINHKVPEIGDDNSIIELYINVHRKDTNAKRPYFGVLDLSYCKRSKGSNASGMKYRYIDYKGDEVGEAEVGLKLVGEEQSIINSMLGLRSFDKLNLPRNIVEMQTSIGLSADEVTFDSYYFPELEEYNMTAIHTVDEVNLILCNSIKRIINVKKQSYTVHKIAIGENFSYTQSLVKLIKSSGLCVVYVVNNTKALNELNRAISTEEINVVLIKSNSENEARLACRNSVQEIVKKWNTRLFATTDLTLDSEIFNGYSKYDDLRKVYMIEKIISDTKSTDDLDTSWYNIDWLKLTSEELNKLAPVFRGYLGFIKEYSTSSKEIASTLEKVEQTIQNRQIKLEFIWLGYNQYKIEIANTETKEVLYECLTYRHSGFMHMGQGDEWIQATQDLDRYDDITYQGISISHILKAGDILYNNLEFKADISGIVLNRLASKKVWNCIRETWKCIADVEMNNGNGLRSNRVYERWYIDLISGDYIQAYYSMNNKADEPSYMIIKDIYKHSDIDMHDGTIQGRIPSNFT